MEAGTVAVATLATPLFEDEGELIGLSKQMIWGLTERLEEAESPGFALGSKL